MSLAHHQVEVIIGGENQGANAPQYTGGLNQDRTTAVPLGIVIPVTNVRGLWWEAIDNIDDVIGFNHIEVKTRDDDNLNLTLNVNRACLLRVRLHVLFDA
jgi:hypothetical protein